MGFGAPNSIPKFTKEAHTIIPGVAANGPPKRNN
jgi:hypothetical protein